MSRITRHRGLGLVEMLVALSISAALLSAVGMAIDASFKSYSANEEQASLTQRARLAMHRMQTYIRTTSAHQPKTSSAVTTFAAGTVTTDTGISMYDNTGTAITFSLNSTTHQLILTAGTTPHVLLEGVKTFQVKMEPMRSANAVKTGSTSYDRLMRATILLTIATNTKTSAAGESTGLQTVTMSASVMPRRNIW